MVRKAGQYLVKHYNTWCVEMTIPKELRHHFPHDAEGKKNLRGRYKTKLARSLNTGDFATAEVEKLQWVYKWKKLFQMYRSGEVVVETVDELAERWGQKLERENFSAAVLQQIALEAATVDDPQSITEKNLDEIALRIPNAAIDAFGKSTKNLCAIADHVDEFIASYQYSPSVGGDARSFIKNQFVKHFPYFEWIDEENLKAFVIKRMDGSDGRNAWERQTTRKYLSYVKQYWDWCRERNLTQKSNQIIFNNILPKANKTKAQRKVGKDANLPYTPKDCWLLYNQAKDRALRTGRKNDENLADIILLGMYTGCRIGELAHMKLDDVGEDRFSVADSKTDSGIRDIPIHKEIQQLVERLKQTSTDGYLISGLSDDNQYGNRGKGIGQKFMRHKEALGFRQKANTFHSFRSTLISLMQSAGVEELFCARIVGHAAGNSMSYGLYAGDIDWKVATAAMAKVSYG